MNKIFLQYLYAVLILLFGIVLSIYIPPLFKKSQPEVTTTAITESIETENNSPQKGKFKARVVKIIDGDTVDILYGEKEEIRIRLEHIDCPEKRGKQPYGNAAKKAITDLCYNQAITVSWKGEIDRYGRYIAELYDEEGLNLNKEMVKLGMAWHYKRYSRDNTYSELEKIARENKVGLWQEPNPVPPWNWRK